MEKHDVSDLHRTILKIQHYITTIPYVAVSIGLLTGIFKIVTIQNESFATKLGTVLLFGAFGFFISRAIKKILDAIVIILQHQIEMIYRSSPKDEESVKQEPVVTEEVKVEEPKKENGKLKKLPIKRGRPKSKSKAQA